VKQWQISAWFLTVTGSLLLTGCPTADTGKMDATEPPADAGSPPRDTGPRDSGLGLDAAPEDLGVPDGGLPEDAGFMDAGFMDAGFACEAVGRANAPASLSAAVTRLAARCYPLLSGAEAAAIGARAGAAFGAVLSDPAVLYDETLAGRCHCELDTVACDEPDPLDRLASCRHTISGTTAIGAPCLPNRCVPGAYCTPPFPQAAPYCLGVCTATVAEGDNCQGPNNEILPCGPGLFCYQSKGWFCERVAAIGEDCGNRPCAGDTSWPVIGGVNPPAGAIAELRALKLLFPTTGCRTSSVGSTCRKLGEAGDSCAQLGCGEFYRCDDTLTCQLKPTRGATCTLPFDVAMPSFEQQQSNLIEARTACRVNVENALGGDYCVQTGTTSGRATCTRIPSATEGCGIGQGVSPLCAPGSWCDAIDATQLAPIMGTCEPLIPAGDMCDPGWTDQILGPSCASGRCTFGDPPTCQNDPNGCIND